MSQSNFMADQLSQIDNNAVKQESCQLNIHSSYKKQRPNPLVIEFYLNGIEFPATQQQLLQCAILNNAPTAILETLNQIVAQTYSCHIDISKAIGKLDYENGVK